MTKEKKGHQFTVDKTIKNLHELSPHPYSPMERNLCQHRISKKIVNLQYYGEEKFCMDENMELYAIFQDILKIS